MSHYLPIRHFGIIVSLLPHLSVFAVPSEYDAAPRLEKRATPSSIGIDAATLTSKWFEGSDKVQIIEMILTNHDTAESFTKAEDLTITASSSYFDLVKPARITRLTAGQQVVAQIGIKNKEGFAPGDSCSGTIIANWVGGRTTSKNITGSCGFGDYTATKASLNKHWTPDWYNNAKFGIFIHWGVYSVPAFGNVGDEEDYAEWYWMRMTQPNYKSQTYQHHRDTYGENFNYDDFIPSFTGDKFNAKEWVDLMAEAGARYIVPVTSKLILKEDKAELIIPRTP